jgi:hypothetical protein
MTENLIIGFICLCSLVSAGFLGGTIYWVHKMTCKREANQLQASSLNYFTVSGHVGLLIIQSTVAYFSFYAKSAPKIKLSTAYKISSTQNISTALLDLFLCCLICFLIYDKDFYSCFRQGADFIARMTSSSNEITSSDSDETSEKKADKKIKKFERQWLGSFHHDNTFDLSFTDYEQCVKAAAQFLNAIGKLNEA